MFDALDTLAPDPILGVTAAFRRDTYPLKVDLGVGVYRDEHGITPVPAAVREAERALIAAQSTKTYVGPAGNLEFNARIVELALGPLASRLGGRIPTIQTVGGCGALRVGAELVRAANPDAVIHVSTPTWANHEPLVGSSGLRLERYPYYDPARRDVDFDAMHDHISRLPAGSVVLLHGCCHNPTGADLDEGQWREVAMVVAERGLIPFIDIAYQGFGRGLDEDAYGVRLMLETCDEMIIAQSCDKNFSVYRDRVGSLWIKSPSKETTANAMALVFQIAREMWSMPPDHGAAAVHIILDDPALKERWLVELAAMRDRINAVRQRIAAADPRLAFIGRQYGMFSMLPLSKEQVLKLREDHAIYMAESGRFNVVGMGDAQIDRFIAAVVGAMDS